MISIRCGCRGIGTDDNLLSTMSEGRGRDAMRGCREKDRAVGDGMAMRSSTHGLG